MPSKALRFSDDEPSLLPVEVNENQARISSQEQELQAKAEALNIQVKYYQEFKKIYLTSFKLQCEVRKQILARQIINDKMAKLEGNVTLIKIQLQQINRKRREDDVGPIHDELAYVAHKKVNKRNRRTAEQIQRKFYCPHEFCDRCYGSEGSLQQHFKLKHPELYMKDDESQSYA